MWLHLLFVFSKSMQCPCQAGKLKNFSTRPNWVVSYIAYTKFHSPSPVFHTPDQIFTRIGERASASFPACMLALTQRGLLTSYGIIELTWSSLVQVMACCLFVAKPWPQPMLPYSWRCDMAFIEPMHRNKPNITYLPYSWYCQSDLKDSYLSLKVQWFPFKNLHKKLMFAKFMSVIWYWSLSMLLKYLSLPWPPVEMALMGHSHLDNWGLLAQCLAFLILRTAFLSCHKPAMHLKWLYLGYD